MLFVALDLIYCPNTWLLMFLMPPESVCVCAWCDVCVSTSLCGLKTVCSRRDNCANKSLASAKPDKAQNRRNKCVIQHQPETECERQRGRENKSEA